jgi:hypothetical protein
MADFVVGIGRTDINETTGDQTFSASMEGHTPKAALFWVTQSASNDTIVDDNYVDFGMTDGVNAAFTGTWAVNDAVSPSSGGRYSNFGTTVTSINLALTSRNPFDGTNLVPRLRFVSFGTERVVLNVGITTRGAGYFLNYALLGGDSFTAFMDHDTATINRGASTDRTGLGVPAEAAIVVMNGMGSGFSSANAISVPMGFWGAKANSERCSIAGNWGGGDTIQEAQQAIRNDVNGHTLGASQAVYLEQIARGVRVVNNSASVNVTLARFTLMMSFAGTREAWAGLLETPTTLGSYSWPDPGLSPDFAFSVLTRRLVANLNTGDGDVDDEDASTMGFAGWTPDDEFAVAGISRPTNPSLSKMHSANRFISIPNGSDGSLSGSATTPASDDAILATATGIGTGLAFDFTRTSSDSRLQLMLVIGSPSGLAVDEEVEVQDEANLLLTGLEGTPQDTVVVTDSVDLVLTDVELELEPNQKPKGTARAGPDASQAYGG